MKTRGFTLVEFVIIITVIAVLAGIGLVSYGSWRHDATKKAITADLKAAATAMDQHRNFNNEYPTTLPSNFNKSTRVTLVQVQNSGTQSYCLEGTNSPENTIRLRLKSSVGNVEEQPC